MTTPEHMKRVAQAAFAASFAHQREPSEDVVCTIGGYCSSPTCGVVTAILRGQLVSAGFSSEEAQRLNVRGEDFVGGHPAMAYVYVETPTGPRQIARLHDLDEARDPHIFADIKKALELWSQH